MEECILFITQLGRHTGRTQGHRGECQFFIVICFAAQYRHTFCMSLLNLVLFNVTVDISQTLQCTKLGTLSLCLNLKINTPELVSFKFVKSFLTFSNMSFTGTANCHRVAIKMFVSYALGECLYHVSLCVVFV